MYNHKINYSVFTYTNNEILLMFLLIIDAHSYAKL